MRDRSGSHAFSASLMARCLAAASRRLTGRWEDPAAWRTVCEELTAAWSEETGVAWAALFTRDSLQPIVAENGQQPSATLVWHRQAGRSWWCEASVDQDLWARLAAADNTMLASHDRPPLPADLPGGSSFAADQWLACGVAGGRNLDLALVLGCDAAADVQALQSELSAARALLAPLLSVYRRLADLTAAAAANRSECEALSRLGELRARLAAVTAHELKTPLTSITAYAEVLQEKYGAPDFVHAEEFLRVIRSEADRLLRLVERLLDSSRRGSGPVLVNPQPFGAGPLVEEVRRLMAPQAAARDLRLQIHVPKVVPRLEGDADLVRQVLLNLLGNALKFTPSGGRITMLVREEASTVRLAVSDSGPGIAPQELRTIFQSFYRTRAAAQTEGLGLGLSIVKEIVNLHGGYLDVHSRHGRGSTFGVHLPKEQERTFAGTALAQSGRDEHLLDRLARHTLRLVAELSAARAVAILLPAVEPGRLVTAAAMGLAPSTAGIRLKAESGPIQRAQQRALILPGGSLLPPGFAGIGDQPGAAMVAPLRLGENETGGLILAARRQDGGVFGGDDLLLLRVLAEILSKAWSAACARNAAKEDQAAVIEALATLTGLRRSGVPTADPLALRVLSRTGRRLGLSPFEIRLLQYAGALHDAGMALLDPDVLHKPAALDLDERDRIDGHPQRGLDLLGPLVELPELQAIIRYHHERIDGQGYPEGRCGTAIPLGSRILAVVDAFFAMIRSRPWREGLSVAAAVAEIRRHAGSQFDAEVVAGFLATLLDEGLLAPLSVERTVGSGPRRS